MSLFQVKQDVGGLMENLQRLAEIENKRDEELRSSQMECEEMKKKIKSIEESKEIEKMKFEDELKSSRIECEEMKKKIKRVEESKEIENMKVKEECEEMKRKIRFLEESKDSEILILRNKLLVAGQELEDLKFRKMEAEKAAEFLEKKFGDLETTIIVMEAKVDDLEKLVNHDVENVVVKSRVVETNCGSTGLVKKDNVKKQSSSIAGCSTKRALSSSSPALDIIELSDSDDELTDKRKRTESKGVKNPIIKRRYCSLDFTDSEDESYSDTCMKNYVAGIRDESRFKRALNDDDEFCMNAVCALYRQQIYAAKSKSQCGSSLSKAGGFSHFDLMSGSDLAEYLIDDDPEMKLRKSVSQVKDQRPEVIDQCRKLATYYKENLYTIYSTGEDPFFCQTKP